MRSVADQCARRCVDIVVATPGRLVDLIERRSCRLDAVEVTVLDEADHMAASGSCQSCVTCSPDTVRRAAVALSRHARR